jgi:hypothetical protein
VATAELKDGGEGWKEIVTEFCKTTGNCALYFCVREGCLDFAAFEVK